MQILSSSMYVVALCGAMCKLNIPPLCYLKWRWEKSPLNLAEIGWTGEADCWTPEVAQPASLFKQLSKSAAAELGEKRSSQVCKPSLVLQLQSDGIENRM